jgi:hypothetical protein
MGAQVGVMALAMAVVSLSPDYRLLKNIGKGIPVWILVLVYLIIQALSSAHASLALLVSYLVAASTGLLYVMLLNKGRDLGKWMHQLLALLNLVDNILITIAQITPADAATFRKNINNITESTNAITTSTFYVEQCNIIVNLSNTLNDTPNNKLLEVISIIIIESKRLRNNINDQIQSLKR